MSMYNISNDSFREFFSEQNCSWSHWAGNGAIANLEKKLCSLYGAKHALCVDSATNGLMYLILATGLKRKEILTSSLGFGGTIAGALALDCKFHFSDIEDNSLNISPDDSIEILRKQENIKAVIATDFAGIPHDMETFHRICQERGIWHFVDAAQSLGAKYNQPDIAKFSDAIVVSFGACKAISGGGEGGAIMTDNSDLYNNLISVCQHAHRQERDLGIGTSHDFALNGRMHPLAAILACDSFDNGLAAICKKREMYNRVLKILSDFDSISSVFWQKDSAFYYAPVVVKDNDLFQEEFASSVLSKDYYYTQEVFLPLSLQLELKGFKRRVKTTSHNKLKSLTDRLYFIHKKTTKP